MKKKILFSGELPPNSVHGVALSNQLNIKFLSEKYRVEIDEEISDLKYHSSINIYKFKFFFLRLKKIFFFTAFSRFDFFYITFSSSKLGVIKTLGIIALFRLFNPSALCVLHIHRGDLNLFVQKSIINRILVSLSFISTHRIIVLSEITKCYIKREFGHKYEVNVLPNTVNFEENFGQIIGEIASRKTAKRFIYMSNYIEEKGILILLETFKQLDDSFKLECFGSFTNLDIEKKVMTFNSTKIKINGPINWESKNSLLKQFDALILPSYNEGKPLVILEAMSLGIPFIAHNVGYIKEMIFDNYPFIYENNTIDNLFKIITKFSNYSVEKKLNLKEALVNYYFSNNSNLKHKETLFKIFRD